MHKQLRIIIGDNGGDFAANYAAALHRAGDWAILRRQQYEMLVRAGWQYGLHIDHRMTNSEFISFAVEWLHTEQVSREIL